MGTTGANAADTQEDEVEGANNTELSFADKVNDAVKNMKVNDKGVYELPADLPEEVRVAAMAEKKFRDTQSAFTKTNQKLKTLEAEKTILLTKATENVTIELSQEQKDELEELKFSDTEAWRKKLNSYERDAVDKHRKKLEQEVKEVSTSTLDTEELERRKQVLSDFKKEHPSFDLNDDIIANDIPPRLTKKLAEGNITFDEFVVSCYEYLNKGKTIKDTEDAGKRPNLSKLGGKSSPDDKAIAEDTLRSYEKEIY